MRAIKLLLLVVAFAFSFSASRAKVAFAADDAATIAAVDKILAEEYASANFGAARRKLEALLARCKTCGASARASIQIGLGMVASQTGKKEDARTSFAQALNLSPSVALPSRGVTPDIKNEWGDEVRKIEEKKKAEEEKKRAAEEEKRRAADEEEAKKAAEAAEKRKAAEPTEPEEEATVQSPSGTTGTSGRVPGWNSPEAFREASEGLAADQGGKLEECIKHDQKSVELEDQPRTRLHLASCEARSGKLLDALKNTQKALETGIRRRDVAVMKAARERIQRLVDRIPHVTFVPPTGVADLQVTFDDRPVPNESLRKRFSIDPGKHVVHASGVQNGIPLTFEQEYNVSERDLLTVNITLKSQAPEFLTRSQLECMARAKSQEDVIKCLPQKGKNLVIKASADMAGYIDTNAVKVVTPEMTASVSSPTAGWNVGGSFLVDVISAASPDIVSEASPPFHETRYAGGLSAGYKPGKFGVSAVGNVSREPDYLSISGGGAVTGDFRDKLITPRLGYNYMHDTIGRSDSGFDVYSRTLITHTFEAGATFILSPTSLVLVSGSTQLERGEQSKPYRYVPMFTPGVAAIVFPGVSITDVNAFRLPMRPVEQLPTERDRYALGIRYVKRLGNSTLRLEERLYYDTWDIKATTTDMRYVMDLSRSFRVWPHLRAHLQSGAEFYQLAYAAYLQPNTQKVVLPLYRSGDRELSPLLTLTAGGGTRIALGSGESSTSYGLSFQADVMYTRFFNALYILQRVAVYGSVGFDVEFE